MKGGHPALLQIIVNGLATGSVYALIATGFSLIFNVLKFSNSSHGALMTLSAFCGYFTAAQRGLGLIPTILVVVVTGVLVALAGEFIVFRRITLNNTSPVYFFVSSITLGTMFEGIVTVKVGANFYNYPQLFQNSTIKFGSVVISTPDLLMSFCSVVTLLTLAYILQKIRQGRGLRSVSFDRDTASLMGINVTCTIQFTFIVSGALVGPAGVFLGINYTPYPTLGSFVVKGFIASVIGGLGSLTGAIIGAVLLGSAETILISLVGSGYTPVFTFLLTLAFLLVRSSGIAGSNVQEKA